MRPLMMTPFVLGMIACSGPKDASDDTDVVDTDVVDTDSVDTDVADTDATDTDVSDTDVEGQLAIADVWLEGTTVHTVSDARWTQTYAVGAPSAFDVSQYANAGHYLIALNAAENEYFPSLWSRFDWTVAAGITYYCQTAYNAATEAAALATPAADASDLDAGCGNFSWSVLTAALDIRGTWVDSFGGSHVVDETTWTQNDDTYVIASYDNTTQTLIAQNGPDNAYDANLWSRFDWAESAGTFYFCQTAFNAASAQAAQATAAANAADLDAGCAGFGWSSFVTP